MNESIQIAAVLIGLVVAVVVVLASRAVGRNRYPASASATYAGFHGEDQERELLLLECEGHCDGATAHETDGAEGATCVCKHVSRPHGTEEFWYHPRTGGRRFTRAPDGLFSLAAPVHQPITGPSAERLSEPNEPGTAEPKHVLTNTTCVLCSTLRQVPAPDAA